MVNFGTVGLANVLHEGNISGEQLVATHATMGLDWFVFVAERVLAHVSVGVGALVHLVTLKKIMRQLMQDAEGICACWKGWQGNVAKNLQHC